MPQTKKGTNVGNKNLCRYGCAFFRKENCIKFRKKQFMALFFFLHIANMAKLVISDGNHRAIGGLSNSNHRVMRGSSLLNFLLLQV